MGISIITKFSFPIACFIFALYGLYHYVANNQRNMCEMTYMFEYPEYMKIPIKSDQAGLFSRYSLYVYGEGKYFEELESGKLEGIPVLFIPGNAGSHRQVRSLASVALRMGQSLHSHVHFNFFSINFNEEMSALFGGTLMEQTNFVGECVKQILSMYSTKKKIILIGHSMGGVITEAAFSLPSFNPSVVSLIITLAAPLKEPVIALDDKIAQFYKVVNQAWKHRLKTQLSNIPIISIGGGDRDILVRSELTHNSFPHKRNLDISTLVTSIPGVWVSTDHLAIVWCKQLVLTVCRSLFDLIDSQKQEITSSPTMIEKVLKHHYLFRNSLTHFPRLPSVPIATFPTSGQWIEQESNTWRFSRSKVLSTIYLLVPVIKGDDILIVATGLVKREWIYGCTKLSESETKTCTVGENLSDKGEIIPSKSKTAQRRLINLDDEELQKKKYFYLLIYITPVDSQVDIIGERYNANQRSKSLHLPELLKRWFVPSVRLLSISLPEQSMFFNITVAKSAGVCEATEFQLETRLCRAGSVVGQGIVKMHILHSNEVSYHHIRTTMGGVTTIPVKAHNLPPFGSNREVNLQLILDPECSVVLTARFPFHLFASQFMKFYGTSIISYVVIIIFTFFAGQLHGLGQSGSCPSFCSLFCSYPTFIFVVGISTVIQFYISVPFHTFLLIPPYDNYGQNLNFSHVLLMKAILYSIACGFVITLYALINLFLKASCAIWLQVKRNAMMVVSEVPMEQERKVKIVIKKSLIIWCAFVATISIGISCSVGIQLTCIFYLVKLVSLYMRCKSEEERRGPSPSTTAWYFHLTVFFLLLCTLALTFPSFITWFKSLKYTLRTPSDVNRLQSVIVIAAAHYFWQLPTPCFHRSYYISCSYVVHFLAVISSLYGIISIYRLMSHIAFCFLTIAICQTLSYVNGISHLD